MAMRIGGSTSGHPRTRRAARGHRRAGAAKVSTVELSPVGSSSRVRAALAAPKSPGVERLVPKLDAPVHLVQQRLIVTRNRDRADLLASTHSVDDFAVLTINDLA